MVRLTDERIESFEGMIAEDGFLDARYAGQLIENLRYYKQLSEKRGDALSDIAFGHVEGDYNDVREWAREALQEDTP
jgi:hypothetical protein